MTMILISKLLIQIFHRTFHAVINELAIWMLFSIFLMQTHEYSALTITVPPFRCCVVSGRTTDQTISYMDTIHIVTEKANIEHGYEKHRTSSGGSSMYAHNPTVLGTINGFNFMDFVTLQQCWIHCCCFNMRTKKFEQLCKTFSQDNFSSDSCILCLLLAFASCIAIVYTHHKTSICN